MAESKEPKISRTNLLRVVEQVSFNENITRPEIAKNLGLTTMSISNIVKTLIRDGILMECEGVKKETSFGRKPTIIDFSDKCPHIIAVSFKRNELTVAEMDFKSRIVRERSVAVPPVKSAEEVRLLIYSVIDIMKAQSDAEFCAIGLTCFGPVDAGTGIILSPGNFYGIGDISLKKELEERYSLPVVIVHDSNAAALAEKRHGRLKDIDSLLYIRIAAGIGCGLVFNGEIFMGDTGLSGELGHMSVNADGPECECGGTGCLEHYVNTDVITERINKAHNFKPELSWEDIVGLYNSDQEMFSSYFEEFSRYLSVAIAGLWNVLDISHFVLEYAGQKSGDRLERRIEEDVRKRIRKPGRMPVEVHQSTFGKDSSLIGACTMVIDSIINGTLEIPNFSY